MFDTLFPSLLFTLGASNEHIHLDRKYSLVLQLVYHVCASLEVQLKVWDCISGPCLLVKCDQFPIRFPVSVCVCVGGGIH